MTDYPPITLRATDNLGNKVFEYAVPFCMQVSVKQLMERAFVLNQTPALADPFIYTVEYYGYSENAGFPGYLGYEIESIGKASTSVLPNNAQFYWQLKIDGVISATGADTAYPGPGSTVLWEYTPIPANPQELIARTQVVHSRRTARSSAALAAAAGATP